MSLASGLALIEAVDIAAPGQPTLLKWPNDLMLGSKKLAGILLERSGDRVAVGFGVNLAQAPAVEGRETASLSGVISPQAFAPLLAGSFARLLASWRQSDGPSLALAWEHRAHHLGAKLSVQISADEVLSGRFGGLDPDGALRLMRDDGTVELIRAADIFLG